VDGLGGRRGLGGGLEGGRLFTTSLCCTCSASSMMSFCSFLFKGFGNQGYGFSGWAHGGFWALGEQRYLLTYLYVHSCVLLRPDWSNFPLLIIHYTSIQLQQIV
jgi:hypothetical protein